MSRLTAYLFAIVLLALALLPARTYSQSFLFPCDSATEGSAVCQEQRRGQTHTDNSLYGKNGVITKAVRVYSIVTGIAAVIIMILAGIKLVLASGDPANVKSAKDTILFAVVGLIVAVLGGAIVQFVLIRL